MELFIDFEAISEYRASDLPYFFCLGKTKKAIEGYFVNAKKQEKVYDEIFNIIIDYINKHYNISGQPEITFFAWGASLEKKVLAKVFDNKGINYRLKDLQQSLSLEGVGQSRVNEILLFPKEYFVKTKAVLEHQLEKQSRRKLDGRIASLIGAKLHNFEDRKMAQIKMTKEQMEVAKVELSEYCNDDVKTMFEIREKLYLLKKQHPTFNLKEEIVIPQKIKSVAKSLAGVEKFVEDKKAVAAVIKQLQDNADSRTKNLKNRVKKMLNKL